MEIKLIDADFCKTVKSWRSRIIEYSTELDIADEIERLELMKPHINKILAKQKLKYKDYEKMLLIMEWVNTGTNQDPAKPCKSTNP